MKCRHVVVRLPDSEAAHDTSLLNEFLETVNVSRIFTSMIGEKNPFWSILIFYEEKSERSGNLKSTIPIEGVALTPSQEKIYNELRKWRNDKGIKEHVRAYVVCHNRWLRLVAKIQPKTKEDLLKIKGFGKKRVEKYGDDVLKIVGSLS